jgi:hypothetical protein
LQENLEFSEPFAELIVSKIEKAWSERGVAKVRKPHGIEP